MVLPFLRKRSKIIEIVAAQDIVFALAQSGVCAAFSRGRISNLYLYALQFCLQLITDILYELHVSTVLCRNQSKDMLFECQSR